MIIYTVQESTEESVTLIDHLMPMQERSDGKGKRLVPATLKLAMPNTEDGELFFKPGDKAVLMIRKHQPAPDDATL